MSTPDSGASAYFALLETAGVIAAREAPYRESPSCARIGALQQRAARPAAATSGDSSRDRLRGRGAFGPFAERVSDVASGATFFALSAALVVLWLPTIIVFRSVDTWQLVINTATSILAFLLVALLQNSERRTDMAASRKLDALAAAVAGLDAQVSGGDRQARVRRARELRDATRLEEDI
jgi:low affinity Fe/Cu permease